MLRVGADAPPCVASRCCSPKTPVRQLTDQHAAEARRVNAQLRSLTNRVDRLQCENQELRLASARQHKGVAVKEAKFTARLRGAVTRINYLLEQRNKVCAVLPSCCCRRLRRSMRADRCGYLLCVAVTWLAAATAAIQGARLLRH